MKLPLRPLKNAYAHRDCEADRPLWDAASLGFTHIEADAYCWFGRVLIAHDLIQLRPNRTLKRLYLNPLLALSKPLFGNSHPLWLFIDVKTAAWKSYHTLKQVLTPYYNILTRFSATSIEPASLTIVISGNRIPYRALQAEPVRHLALDGRVEDIGMHTDCTVMPVISDDWRKHFSWMGVGTMPPAERTKLERWLDTCHGHHQKLRFWGTPDIVSPERTRLWKMLLDLGVDLINTDDMVGLANFLNQEQT